MPDFSKRSDDIEIMDDLQCSGEVVHRTLRELEVINRLLGGNHVTIDGIRKLCDKNAGKVLHVADLGCGGGDILKLIRKWSDRNKCHLRLTGIDANPSITEFALAHTPATMKIEYLAMDIFSEEFKSLKFDVIIGTLFFHHFNDEELIAFFCQLKDQVKTGIVINDIHRHWFSYYSIRWLTKLFSRSSMVKYDAPLSVLRAFKKKELENILALSGIRNYTIRWMWAFRWQVVIDLQKA